ncbi:MAG: type II secretion system F family protein [Candidatus Buchananbacteria bacterium]|nr:type II secretion system F family protein [Candidatus Buchananbacteria bacterium]
MRFTYTAIDQENKISKGALEADNLREATKLLVGKGWYIKKIQAQGKHKLGSMEITLGRVPLMDKMLLVRHLGTMLASSITLSEALSIIAAQSNSPKLKKILTDVISQIRAGQSLSNALAKYPKEFDPFFINILKVGEESGSLEENLNYLAGELEDQNDLKRKIKAASFYPAIILSATLGLGLILAYFVLPKIKDLFLTLSFKLPLSTRILLWTADLFDKHGLAMLVGIIVFVVIFRIAISLKKIKPIWHRFLLHLPIVGQTFISYNLIVIARAMNILLKSGLTIDQAIIVSTNVLRNQVYKKYLQLILPEVQKGKSLSDVIAGFKQPKRHPYFPLLATKMISVGEKTGKLDESFGYLASFYEKEVDASTENFTTIIEPALLIFVGLIVGFVAISVISPIYQVTGQFSA